jgi:uncharacterized protein
MNRARLEGEELRHYLAAITAALVGALRPRRVVLFGSFARGDQNRASDLDLVVIADTDLPFCERIGRALEVCYAASSRLPVEVLVYTPAEWGRMRASDNSFARVVEREGQVLYDGRPQPERSAAVAEAGSLRP